MWTPNTMDELLDERISFVGNHLANLQKHPTSDNGVAVCISNFEKGLVNLKYCKRLNKSSPYYKKLAIKIIMDILHEIETQEYECISIYGILHVTKNKCWLPEETKNNFSELKVALEKIFNEIKNITIT